MMLFIGGMPRSGTTYVGRLLGSHPEVGYWEEPRLLEMAHRVGDISRRLVEHMQVDAHADTVSTARKGNLRQQQPREIDPSLTRAIVADEVTGFLSRMALRYLEESGGRVLVEKTPTGVQRFGWGATLIPEAMFLHVVRDPFDVAASILRWESSNPVAGQDPVASAQQWRSTAEEVDAAIAAYPDRILKLSFEDVVSNPVASLGPVLGRLDLTWTTDMARFVESGMGGVDHSTVGKWRQVLSEDQVRAVAAVLEPDIAGRAARPSSRFVSDRPDRL